MKKNSFSLPAADQHNIHVRHWQNDASSPEKSAKGVVHLLHGMAEHSGRYDALATRLTETGWHLYAHDHRGHGLSATNAQALGFYAEENGWQKVIDDVAHVQRHIRQQHPGLPVVLMGHSMGSFIALQYAILYGESLQGLVLSGTELQSPWMYKLASLPVRLERLRLGKYGRSPLIHMLTFGAFSKKIHPRKTAFDWLSRDPAQVQAYIDDPLCGFDCSTQLWLDLLGGLQQIATPANLDRLPQTLPVYVFAGGHDPMSRNGQGVMYLLSELKKSRLERVEHHIYPLGRHEMLNDINREEVMDNLITWLEQQFPSR